MCHGRSDWLLFLMVLPVISLLGTEDVVILLWFADWMGTHSTY